LQNEVGPRHRRRGIVEEAVQDPRRQVERDARDDPERLGGERCAKEIRFDNVNAVARCKARPQLSRPVRVELDCLHTTSSASELRRDDAGPRAELDDEVGRSDSGVADEAGSERSASEDVLGVRATTMVALGAGAAGAHGGWQRRS
jgi:hypothetical protein